MGVGFEWGTNSGAVTFTSGGGEVQVGGDFAFQV